MTSFRCKLVISFRVRSSPSSWRWGQPAFRTGSARALRCQWRCRPRDNPSYRSEGIGCSTVGGQWRLREGHTIWRCRRFDRSVLIIQDGTISRDNPMEPGYGVDAQVAEQQPREQSATRLRISMGWWRRRKGGGNPLARDRCVTSISTSRSIPSWMFLARDGVWPANWPVSWRKRSSRRDTVT